MKSHPIVSTSYQSCRNSLWTFVDFLWDTILLSPSTWPQLLVRFGLKESGLSLFDISVLAASGSSRRMWRPHILQLYIFCCVQRCAAKNIHYCRHNSLKASEFATVGAEFQTRSIRACEFVSWYDNASYSKPMEYVAQKTKTRSMTFDCQFIVIWNSPAANEWSGLEKCRIAGCKLIAYE